MNIHYHAFISYRHHPDDIRVATQIHRGLERFKIPRTIKKRSNVPMRLFRDKEELPITSHLTDDITRALENSDFLIVICSPHTKESVWVQREIETFLKTHGRDKVLTVLADGEPYDVIPEILLHEDVVNPITGEVERKDIEPLSCDWRMKMRKAVKEELPRLAAPLLQCGYDELKQRQRQYRMRRTIAAFSVALTAALCLMAYFIHTSIRIQKANDDLHAANVQIQEANVRIQENLDQALRNQSEYLAAAAAEQSNAGDRLTAIALALEALPAENNQRPYVPEAERALSAAVHAYQSEDRITAQGAFSVDGLVQQYRVSEDGTRIFIRDAREIMTVWDTMTFRKLATVDLSSYMIEDMFVTAGGNLLLTTTSTYDVLLCYSPDGTLLWQLEHCMDIAFLDGKTKILAVCNDYSGLQEFVILNAETGEAVQPPIPYTQQENGSMASLFFQRENRGDLPIPVKFFAGNMNYVYLLDLQTGSLREVMGLDTSFAAGGYSIDHAAVTDDGNLIVMRGDSSGIYNGNYQTFQITSPDRTDILCYDTGSLALLWESQITNYIFSRSRTIESVPDSDRILIQSGDVIQIHDAATGEKLLQCQLPAIPLFLKVEAEEVWGITQDGASFDYYYETDQCRVASFVDGALDLAEVNRGYYTHTPLSYHVTVYRSMRDQEAKAYQGKLGGTISSSLIHQNRMMVWSGMELSMVDLAGQRVMWQQEFEHTLDPLGFSKDGTKLWQWDNWGERILVFDVESGRLDEIPVDFSIEENITTCDCAMFLAEDIAYCILECDGRAQLWRMDLNTGTELEPVELKSFASEIVDFKKSSRLLMVQDSYLWILREDRLCVVDLRNGNMRTALPDASQPTWTLTEEGLLILGDGNRILQATQDGRVMKTMDLGEKKVVSLYWLDGQVLALCDDGAVYRYDLQGNLLSRTVLELYDTFYSNVSYGTNQSGKLGWWQTADGDVILNAYGAGNIIDGTLWQSKAFVPHISTYEAEEDQIVCYWDGVFYAYSRYSTDRQMQRAREALGDFRLTEEQKKYYGLN